MLQHHLWHFPLWSAVPIKLHSSAECLNNRWSPVHPSCTHHLIQPSLTQICTTLLSPWQRPNVLSFCFGGFERTFSPCLQKCELVLHVVAFQEREEGGLSFICSEILVAFQHSRDVSSSIYFILPGDSQASATDV